MSVTRVQTIGCACGESMEALVFISLNAERHPAFRQQLLDRELHVFPCRACGTPYVVEAAMGYVDLGRKQLMATFSEADRYNERACSEQLMETWRTTIVDGPPWLAAQANQFLVRVCFGLEELREKLVIDDAGLHDLPLEVMKGDMLAADPWFAASRVATLCLDHVNDDGDLVLLPFWHEPPKAPPTPVIATRELYEEYRRKGEAELLRLRPNVASGPYVNILRYAYTDRPTPPRPT